MTIKKFSTTKETFSLTKENISLVKETPSLVMETTRFWQKLDAWTIGGNWRVGSRGATEENSPR